MGVPRGEGKVQIRRKKRQNKSHLPTEGKEGEMACGGQGGRRRGSSVRCFDHAVKYPIGENGRGREAEAVVTSETSYEGERGRTDIQANRNRDI